MIRQLMVLSTEGHTLLAETDTENGTAKLRTNDVLLPADIAAIEALFKQYRRDGYAAFDITDQKNEQINLYDPNADILFVPALQGGAIRTFSRLNREGDGKVFEFDDGDPNQVAAATKEFSRHRQNGYAPFDSKNEQMASFRADTDVLFVPQIQGGMSR